MNYSPGLSFFVPSNFSVNFQKWNLLLSLYFNGHDKQKIKTLKNKNNKHDTPLTQHSRHTRRSNHKQHKTLKQRHTECNNTTRGLGGLEASLDTVMDAGWAPLPLSRALSLTRPSGFVLQRDWARRQREDYVALTIFWYIHLRRSIWCTN